MRQFFPQDELDTLQRLNRHPWKILTFLFQEFRRIKISWTTTLENLQKFEFTCFRDRMNLKIRMFFSWDELDTLSMFQRNVYKLVRSFFWGILDHKNFIDYNTRKPTKSAFTFFGSPLNLKICLFYPRDRLNTLSTSQRTSTKYFGHFISGILNH